MRFQPVKCNMMQLTNKRSSKIQANYTLEGTVLENVESIKYPQGGTLKFSVYIGEADFFGVKILNFRIFLGCQKN